MLWNHTSFIRYVALKITQICPQKIVLHLWVPYIFASQQYVMFIREAIEKKCWMCSKFLKISIPGTRKVDSGNIVGYKGCPDS